MVGQKKDSVGRDGTARGLGVRNAMGRDRGNGEGLAGEGRGSSELNFAPAAEAIEIPEGFSGLYRDPSGSLGLQGGRSKGVQGDPEEGPWGSRRISEPHQPLCVNTKVVLN